MWYKLQIGSTFHSLLSQVQDICLLEKIQHMCLLSTPHLLEWYSSMQSPSQESTSVVKLLVPVPWTFHDLPWPSMTFHDLPWPLSAMKSLLTVKRCSTCACFVQLTFLQIVLATSIVHPKRLQGLVMWSEGPFYMVVCPCTLKLPFPFWNVS